MNDHADQPVRPAATVIIARDADPQYQIFMLRRTSNAAFAGGMYVFPGGRVDDYDHAAGYQHHLQGPTAAQDPQKAALGDDWQAYWVAGIRETFEEAGLLLAYAENEKLLTYEDEATWEKYQAYRGELHQGTLSLAEICDKENLSLALDRIHFYNRWITPLGRPRRFDTRFFITQAPREQTGLHDGMETVDNIWISPNEALRLNGLGKFGLMAVTEKQLSTFAAYQTVNDLMTMAGANRDFPTYRPVIPPPISR